MKRQTLAMLIASAFALSACAPQPAPEDKPAAGSAPVAATSAPAAASAPAASAAAEAEVPASELPVIDAVLTKAPEVPPAIDRDHAARVKVNIEVQEKVMKMADGVDYKYWTFNGDVPGSFIRVREGDQVEVHFSNRSDSTVPHNIDFHAATGPGGGAAIVEMKLDVPGSYTVVDHSLFRAFNKGALGQLVAEGAENKDIFSGKTQDLVYQGEGGTIQTAPLTASEASQVAAGAPKAASKEERIKAGESVYQSTCSACHGAEGKGVEGAFPPLAGSDYLNADPKRGIHAVVKGLSGEITVNGKKFNSVMPAQALDDEKIANVLTYVLNSFGNKGGEVKPEDVAAARK